MSTTVTYKGATLTTVDNDTVTLDTAGKYCEDDFTLTDVSGGGGSGPYVVGIVPYNKFAVNNVINQAGETVTVSYTGSGSMPLPPGSQLVVADVNGTTLIVLKNGGSISTGATFTFTMPSESVVVMYSGWM